MLKIGVIGAGSIANMHLDSYAKNQDATVVAIADINEALAKEKAERFGVKNYYADYRKILEDDQIDAVSIVTPTFTHCDITVEALKAGKQVLCEKPPAINVEQVERAVAAARESGKLLMWAMPCRFSQEIQFLKKYVDAGKMGRILQAEAVRTNRYSGLGGWYVDKEKSGGGTLMDAAIHQIDEVMYLMGYPKVKEVLGFSTDINKDLYGKIKGTKSSWTSADKNKSNYTIETAASGYVTFDNGACLYVRAGKIMYTVKTGVYIDLVGENGGARFEHFPDVLTMISNVDDYMVESKPIINNSVSMFETEINHFVDCCINNTKCICEDWQGIELIKVIEGIYKSAETGKPVAY